MPASEFKREHVGKQGDALDIAAGPAQVSNGFERDSGFGQRGGCGFELAHGNDDGRGQPGRHGPVTRGAAAGDLEIDHRLGEAGAAGGFLDQVPELAGGESVLEIDRLQAAEQALEMGVDGENLPGINP